MFSSYNTLNSACLIYIFCICVLQKLHVVRADWIKKETGSDWSIYALSLHQASEKVSCFHASCGMSSHLICLARHFLQSEPSQLLPVEGACPSCRHSVLWGSLIRQKHGCLGDLEEIADFSSSVSQPTWPDHLWTTCERSFLTQTCGWSSGPLGRRAADVKTWRLPWLVETAQKLLLWSVISV